MNVILEIYSINGVLVKKIEGDYFDTGYRLGPISWDGKNDYGRRTSSGMYIAHLKITTSDGDFMSKSIRLILLSE